MKRILFSALIAMLFVVPRVALAEDQSVRLFVGSDIASCVDSVDGIIAGLAGVQLAEIDFNNEWIFVRFDDSVITTEELMAVLLMSGYESVPLPVPPAG